MTTYRTPATPNVITKSELKKERDGRGDSSSNGGWGVGGDGGAGLAGVHFSFEIQLK